MRIQLYGVPTEAQRESQQLKSKDWSRTMRAFPDEVGTDVRRLNGVPCTCLFPECASFSLNRQSS